MLTERECIAALPERGFLRDYVYYASKRTDAHVGYHIVCGLGLLSQTVPVTLGMRFAGVMTYPNIFGIIVAPSSLSRKSHAMDIALDIFNEVDVDGTMEDPASKESLIHMLAERSRQLLVYPEFAKFLVPALTGPKEVVKATLNDVYDCTQLSNATVKAKREKLNTKAKTPRLSIIAACAPEFLGAHASEVDWTGGFFARFFFIVAKRSRYFKRPSNDYSARSRLVTAFNNMRKNASDGVKDQNRCLGFTDSANRLWDPWVTNLEQRAEKFDIPALISRAAGLARRVAMLLACDIGKAFRNEPWYIGAEEMRSAIAIAELHIKSILEMSPYIVFDQDGKDRLKVLAQLLKAYDEGKKHGIYKPALLKVSNLSSRRFASVVETLANSHTISITSATQEASELFRLHPEYLAERNRIIADTGSDITDAEDENDGTIDGVPLFPEDATDKLASVTVLRPATLGLQTATAAQIAEPETLQDEGMPDPQRLMHPHTSKLRATIGVELYAPNVPQACVNPDYFPEEIRIRMGFQL